MVGGVLAAKQKVCMYWYLFFKKRYLIIRRLKHPCNKKKTLKKQMCYIYNICITGGNGFLGAGAVRLHDAKSGFDNDRGVTAPLSMYLAIRSNSSIQICIELPGHDFSLMHSSKLAT